MKVSNNLVHLILISLFLASCAAPPGGPARFDGESAEQLFLQEKFTEAAVQFQQQAQDASAGLRTHLLLRAAASYARAGQLQLAEKILATIKLDKTDPVLSSLYRLTQAHIAFAERQSDAVLQHLQQPMATGTEQVYLAEYHDLKATAYSIMGNRIESTNERVKRDIYLVDSAIQLSNQRKIWESLSLLSERSLQQYQSAAGTDTLGGWMELVRLSKTYQLNPVMLRSAITQWQRNYPAHPVNPEIITALMDRKVEDVVVPENIALLLPLSGRFASAAEAIRDGFLAAYYSRQNTAPLSVRIYDTAGEIDKAFQAYQQAVQDGARFIIGPLNKDAISWLVQNNHITVPTLALNYLGNEEEIPSNLYQFGLIPEEEARQVAERTWLDGHIHAAVLSPEGVWGDRVYQAFSERWQELGGKVIKQQSYNANQNDFSDPIQTLLNIDESERRHRALSNLLNQKLFYSARRRQDIDFIFLAAYPRQARQIRPQLKFFHATDVPVYATSHIFAGNLNPDQDRDMDGLRFGDMPWVLTESTSYRGLHADIESLISPAGNKLQRLYAMGIDSLNLVAALNTLKAYPFERYQGETGSLSMDARQRIKRQLTWVYFRSGRPVLLDQESSQ